MGASGEDHRGPGVALETNVFEGGLCFSEGQRGCLGDATRLL